MGRLDTDSEGLLLLSNDKKLNHALLDPKNKHNRTYLAQVEGVMEKEKIEELVKGITIKVDGKDYQTLPCKAESISEPALPERNPPIRFRKNIPTSWIKIILHEGKNRQVRKMTAAVGYPTLRLIRESMEDVDLGTMQPGDVEELKAEAIYRRLKIRSGKG